MKDRLFNLLGVESGEESMITVLLTQSVFLGIFFGAFDISAHSLFLSIFDEKMMARGYVVSGVAGIILTLAYTMLQARMSFKNFATINLMFVTIATLVLWILLQLSQSKMIVFLVFVMLGPLNILAMLGFWGTVGRLFTLRQGKRLFGLVDSGLIMGIILSCYAIPVLLSLSFKPHNILLISSGAILTATVVQIFIGRRFLNLQVQAEVTAEKAKPRKSVIKMFREDPYIRIMGIFIALSVMTAFFVQYSFMAVTREQYPAESDMARFLGIFTGSMMIFTFLVKILVFSFLIRNYGLRTCLAISPFLIAGLTIVAVAVGMIMGYTPAASGFMLFFMILALSRLFSKSLKDSLESPSFKVIYQTIDEGSRYEVQSGMDGTMNEIAALSSGLLLALLGIISSIKLIHFSFVLVLIVILWIISAYRLYAGYRGSIRKALEATGQKYSGGETYLEQANYRNSVSANMTFEKDYFNLVTGAEIELSKYSSSSFFSRLLDHAERERDINLIPALKNLSLHAGANNEMRQKASGLAESLEILVASPPQKEDRHLAARKTLADSRQPQTTEILRLLRDNSFESKQLAINIIGKFRFRDMIPEVCDCLNIPALEISAESVLRSFGADADEEIRKFYMTSSGNPAISRTVIRLLGEKCRPENQNFLFSRLWSNSRQIRELALGYLVACGYRASSEEKDRLHQLISDIIGVMVWNLSARVALRRNGDNHLLDVLDLEIARWNRFLFNILSITYDSRSVSRIKENLESGTVESVNYALEMIDMVIDESVKPRLVPLLDNIPDEDKLKSLYQFYPGIIPDYGKLIEDILNRDYNLLGVWIRACALKSLKPEDAEPMTDSLVAILFSPEQLLREESCRILARSSPDLLRSALNRIPTQVRTKLEKISAGEVAEEEFLYSKVLFLSDHIRDTIRDYLLILASSLRYSRDINDIHDEIGGCMIWPADPGGQGSVVHVCYGNSGEALSKYQGRDQGFYILPLKAVENFCEKYPEESDGMLGYLEMHDK